jgi:predicted dehydrogenase
MRKLVMGVLGASGHFFKRVMLPLAASERVELGALASRDGAKAERLAGKWGIPRAYASYEALLADPAVDFVYIPLPNHLHLEWIRKAADAGKHVLCEKPLCLDAAQAREAVDHARGRGVLLMEAFMYRFHPQWVKARDLVRSGELGELQAVHCEFSYRNVDPRNIRNIPECGGGSLLDIGCYAVSSARYLFGAEPLRAVGLARRDPAFGTDTLSSAMLDFGEGRRSLFTVGTQTHAAQRVEAFGSGGSLVVELPFNMHADVEAGLRVKTDVGERRIESGPVDQYLLELEAFAAAVEAGGPLPVPPEDGVANLRALDAIARSLRSEAWEKV